jgi:hypothetical protein
MDLKQEGSLYTSLHFLQLLKFYKYKADMRGLSKCSLHSTIHQIPEHKVCAMRIQIFAKSLSLSISAPF